MIGQSVGVGVERATHVLERHAADVVRQKPRLGVERLQARMCHLRLEFCCQAGRSFLLDSLTDFLPYTPAREGIGRLTSGRSATVEVGMRGLVSVHAFGLLNRGLTLGLAAWLALCPSGTSAVLAEGSAPAPTSTGALAVASDPSRAAVYVDGRFVGRTPLKVERLPAGNHRVRLVKDGYLENGRVVTVVAGKSSSLEVGLTAGNVSEVVPAEPAAGGGQVSTGSGGSSKKWLLIGAAAAGGAAAAVIIAKRNQPPIPGTITVSPTATGMAGVTSYTFTSTGSSDPDGDALTFEWNFGDGGTGSGSPTTHTYASAGTFSVSLNVKDKKESVAAPAASVTVFQSVAGSWSGGRDPGFGLNLAVTWTQSGTTIGGSMIFSGLLSFTASVTGSIDRTTYPAAITFATPAFAIAGFPGTFNYRFSGTVDTRSMPGTIVASSSALLPPSFTASTTFSR